MIKRTTISLLLIFYSITHLVAQTGFIWTKKEFLPERISNNAVCAAQLGDTHYVFSFAGIDSTKLYSGIHLRSYRYNYEADRWDTIPELPDTLGKIATWASHVNGKIYITGGYHVLQNGNEISSNKMHIYDVATNTFDADGPNIPFPIDDHVQVTWRDSLIYLITGWSNNGSYPYVQIYDTYNNVWLGSSSTPNSGIYKCFGASGLIIGDTIYYYGGVTGSFTFNAQSFLRKGVIDPQNPTNITWTQLSDSPGDAGYRCAPFKFGEQLFWIGGAGIAYNYDGIAYSNGQGVPPLGRIVHYEPVNNFWVDHTPTPFDIMDFRGAAEIIPGKVIICGGMEVNQEVSENTFLIELDSMILNVGEKEFTSSIKVYPNPVNDMLFIESETSFDSFEIYSITGDLILNGKPKNNLIRLRNISTGFYILVLKNNKGIYTSRICKN